ncbi:MAG: PHP domain-containing protein [bacterium]|nr:PHP domain-containing protein [bacterium]
MIIDLHIHTLIGSHCSIIEIRDLIIQVKRLKLDGICITDHNNTAGIWPTKKLGEEEGIKVFGGIEVRTREGDVIVFSKDIDTIKVPVGIVDLISWVQEREGVIIPVHPFRRGVPSLDNRLYEIPGFDAIEILNGNCTQEMNILAWLASLKLKIPGTGGSDAHTLKQVGKYATMFDVQIETEEELIKAIKSGNYQAVRWT